MWNKPTYRQRLCARIAKEMGFEYCALLPNARTALNRATLMEIARMPLLPSNICKVAYDHAFRSELMPVSPKTGLSFCTPVHLYGYRANCPETELELDPLMTGWFSGHSAKASIISFGRKKALDIGAGGAFLTNSKDYARVMDDFFPEGLLGHLDSALSRFPFKMQEQWRRVEWWDRHLGDSCIRIPGEQIIPWRVIRRIPEKRDRVVRVLRLNGFDVGTNYPPLPGVTDPGSIQWGDEVINFFVSDDYDEPRIKSACDIVKGIVGAWK